MNRCVFEKLVRNSDLNTGTAQANSLQGLEKVIPDTPSNVTPVHLRDRQIFADPPQVVMPWEKDVGVPKNATSSTQPVAAPNKSPA